MKVAIAVWEDWVSSVLDFAQRLVVADLTDGTEMGRTEIGLPERYPSTKLGKLRELGIDVLICGAVSQSLACAFTACGIQLLPYVTGRVDDVLKAYQAGHLGLPQYRLPGRWPGHAGASAPDAQRRCRHRCRQHDGRRGTRRRPSDFDPDGNAT
jgi:predicted Fe-Mo cluster-binding NifX family protein